MMLLSDLCERWHDCGDRQDHLESGPRRTGASQPEWVGIAEHVSTGCHRQRTLTKPATKVRSSGYN